MRGLLKFFAGRGESGGTGSRCFGCVVDNQAVSNVLNGQAKLEGDQFRDLFKIAALCLIHGPWLVVLGAKDQVKP